MNQTIQLLYSSSLCVYKYTFHCFPKAKQNRSISITKTPALHIFEDSCHTFHCFLWTVKMTTLQLLLVWNVFHTLHPRNPSWYTFQFANVPFKMCHLVLYTILQKWSDKCKVQSFTLLLVHTKFNKFQIIFTCPAVKPGFSSCRYTMPPPP